MNKIEKLIQIKQTEISEMATAIDRMNARVTPETAMTIAVANDVFGGTLKELKNQLGDLQDQLALVDFPNENEDIDYGYHDQIEL
jgi:hypothetical protein